MDQIELNFTAGLTEQFPDFGDVLNAVVYSGKRPAKAIAADLDLSQSMLSRMINTGDTSVSFPAWRLSELIAATGDLRPIFWLVETFCQDQDQQEKRTMNELAELLPRLSALIEKMSEK